MIYSLSGTIQESSVGEVVIECGGVGYLISLPASAASALPAVGQKATVYTHLAVSENDVSLYGFVTQAERQMFLLLTSVSGVGPKVALAILSVLAPEAIVLAVGAGDYKAFTAASGVGPKLGQRLVLELKDKVAKGFAAQGLSVDAVSAVASAGTASASGQAVAALVSLGYTQSEAAQAIAAVDPALPVPEMIRLALRGMGK